MRQQRENGIPKITDPAIIAKVVALIRGGCNDEAPELDGNSELTTVYRIYGANNTLLYVGITSRQILERIQEHHDQPWWIHAQRITLVHYPSRRAALEAEAFAIQVEKPLCNVLHNTEAAE